MRRAWPFITTAILAVLLSTGCATQSENEPQPEPTVTAQDEAHTHEGDESHHPANRDTESLTSASETARAAMTAFARPNLDRETWFTELRPYLSQRAGRDYAYLEPHVLPVNEVTGEPRLDEADTSLVLSVFVPTNAGEYELILTRDDGASPWQVSRFNPPTQ